jgi:predicted nucleic acid-binding protein
MKLLDTNIYIYFFIDDNLKENIDIIKKIIKKNPSIIEIIPSTILNKFNQLHLN